jgi:hypothetical protein
MTRSATQHHDTAENVGLSGQDYISLEENEWVIFPQIESQN